MSEKHTTIVLHGDDDWGQKHVTFYKGGAIVFSDEYADNVVVLSAEQFAQVTSLWSVRRNIEIP